MINDLHVAAPEFEFIMVYFIATNSHLWTPVFSIQILDHLQ